MHFSSERAKIFWGFEADPVKQWLWRQRKVSAVENTLQVGGFTWFQFGV